MRKILGIDLGTNSLGWAIMQENENINQSTKLLDQGVVLFDEGVLIEKGTEKSRAAGRTEKRSARRRNFRRKLRKYETLKLLALNRMVPLTVEEVEQWRQSNFTEYPKNPDFFDWLRTDDKIYKNPYYLRAKALDEKLTPMELGRVFYHLAQRRGFLSNRKEKGQDNETGKVKEGISEITKKMEEAGARSVGEYFWMLYQKDRTKPENKIRTHYLGRKEHYLEEFDKIIQKQFSELIEEEVSIHEPLKRYKGLAKKLYKAIFFQRPLKSQKGLVGNCTFEPKRPRIPVSHPLFEEFRMWQFLNNLQIRFNFQNGGLFGATEINGSMRPLSDKEKEHLIHLFENAPSKSHVQIKDIVKELLKLYPEYKKSKIAYYKSRDAKSAHLLVNYPLEQSVSTSPVRALFRKYLGENWQEKVFKYEVQKPDGSRIEKSADYIDIWHALFTFEDEVLLKNYLVEKIGLDEETAEKFVRFNLPDGYASLSHKAISLILPFLKAGYTYDKAVLLAKIPEIVGKDIWGVTENQEEIINKLNEIFNENSYQSNLKSVVNSTIREIHEARIYEQKGKEEVLRTNLIRYFGKKFPVRAEEDATRLLEERLAISQYKERFLKQETIEEQLKNYLRKKFQVPEKELKKLYHPSMTNIYPPAKPAEYGKRYLGSPIINSIKNPVMMRSLHMLRRLVNELLRKGKIDNDTVIHLELAREVDDANKRKAIQEYQRDREKENQEYKEEIKKLFEKQGVNREPSREDIRRYRLWKDQDEIDIYTGETISLEHLFDGTRYDFEHTVPQSVSLDNSLANLTITSSKFNREVKRNRIPSQLDNFDEIKERLKPWRDKVEDLRKQIDKIHTRGIYEKEVKDRLITKRNKLRMEWEYWNKKVENFLITEDEINQRFRVNQLTDTRVITKYARAYLRSAFPIVHVVNGYMVSEFRKMWGLQAEDEKKSRENHVHHAIDAIVIASMTRPLYNGLVEAYRNKEAGKEKEAREKITELKPWPTFTEDVKKIGDKILIYHDFRDLLPKHTKKKWRKRGKIQYTLKKELPEEIKSLIENGVYKEKDFKKTEEGFYKIPIYIQGDTARGVLHKESFYGAIAQKDEKGNIIKDKNGRIKVDYVKRDYVDNLKKESDAEKIVDPVIRQIVVQGIKRKKELDKEIKALKEKNKNATEEQEKEINRRIEELNQEKAKLFRLPTKKGGFVPIKKVRIKTRISNPIKDFKQHRDLSKLPYKQWYYVENKENYALAMYEGRDANGKVKRDFELVQNIEAAQYFKRSNQERRKTMSLVPEEKKGLPLKYILKKGMSVLFYKETPEELKELSKEELVKRLFVITELKGDGRIRFIPQQVGGEMTDLKKNQTKSFLVFDKKHLLFLTKKNWNFIVNGIDFKMEIDGTIKWVD